MQKGAVQFISAPMFFWVRSRYGRDSGHRLPLSLPP